MKIFAEVKEKEGREEHPESPSELKEGTEENEGKEEGHSEA